MGIVMEMPCGVSDIEKVFEVVEFLENKQELLEKFRPEVMKYIVKDSFFSPPFRQKYQAMFQELIVSLIRREITSHFTHFTAEEIMLLTDPSFLMMIDDGHLFNKNKYMEVTSE